MNRVLVTGGSGFIGTNLVEHLLAQDLRILNLDLQPPRTAAAQAVWRAVDLLDAAALRREFVSFDPDVVVHLAARTDMHGPTLDDYAANTRGVAHVIDAVSHCRSVRRVVFASSRLVCRIGYQPRHDTDYQPTTPYGESKVLGEQMVRDAGLSCEWMIVRPTSIWGPWFQVPYRTFFDAIRAGRYVHPSGHRIRKSFGYVGNTVVQLQALAQAPAEQVHQRMFYLADYEPIEVRGWGEKIRDAFSAPPIRDVPLAAMRMLARLGDQCSALGWKSVPLTSFRLNNLLTEMLHDTAPLQAVCGPLPFSVDAGVERTTAWIAGRTP